jgi:hypothetical protein
MPVAPHSTLLTSPERTGRVADERGRPTKDPVGSRRDSSFARALAGDSGCASVECARQLVSRSLRSRASSEHGPWPTMRRPTRDADGRWCPCIAAILHAASPALHSATSGVSDRCSDACFQAGCSTGRAPALSRAPTQDAAAALVLSPTTTRPPVSPCGRSNPPVAQLAIRGLAARSSRALPSCSRGYS